MSTLRQNGLVARLLVFFIIFCPIVATAATHLSAENGMKATGSFEVGRASSYRAEVRIVKSAPITSRWASLAAVGVKDKNCNCLIYFYIGNLYRDDNKLWAWVKYMEDRKVIAKIDLDISIQPGEIAIWKINWDSLGNVQYSMNGSQSKKIATRIRNPNGVELVSGANAQFDIK